MGDVRIAGKDMVLMEEKHTPLFMVFARSLLGVELHVISDDQAEAEAEALELSLNAPERKFIVARVFALKGFVEGEPLPGEETL
ncbi:MAG: hypothetical protein SFU83_23590 [Meiothermus sp.]|nr:hypothetical protein [Meiothermus sp.]